MAVLEFLESVGLWNTPPRDDAMSSNYRTYGARMGLAGYDEFVRRANAFFDEATSATESGNVDYTRVILSKKRVAFDYKCELRGIFTHDGKPVAFYTPDYKAAGFAGPEEELETFKKSGV